MAAPITIVVTFIFIANFITSMNYPRTIDLNDYINPLLDGNKLYSHHAFVLGVRNTLDKLRKRLLYFGSVNNHGNPASRNVMYFIILMSGDIELNPGPNSIYPCEYREIPVTWEHQHIAIWYHSTCLEYSSNKVELLQRSNVSWICCKCDSQNIDSFTFHSFEFEISNFSSVLSTSCTSTIPSIDLSFSPTTYNSPKPHKTRMKSRLNTLSSTSSVQSTRTRIQPKRKNFRTLVINCQSIKNKRCELQATTEYIKPDIIIQTARSSRKGSIAWFMAMIETKMAVAFSYQ